MKKTSLTIKLVKVVVKNEFAAIALNIKYETFIVYILSLNSTPLNVYLSHKPKIASLIAKEALREVFVKFANFADVFFSDLMFKLFEYIGINNHAIKLVDSQQLFYQLIYSIGPIELEILKVYIETNLVNGFIRRFKLPKGPPILFN